MGDGGLFVRGGWCGCACGAAGTGGALAVGVAAGAAKGGGVHVAVACGGTLGWWALGCTCVACGDWRVSLALQTFRLVTTL